jgi:hypothetical protein
MRQAPHISKAALKKAFHLGVKMAQTERRIIPYLSDAHQYTSYRAFMVMHQRRLEQHHAFEPWDMKIVALAEREASRLDAQQPWELASRIEVPLRSSFWFGWERAYRLKHLYEQQVELARRQHAPSAVLRVHNPPVSPLIPSSPLPEKVADDDRWANLAVEMFENLDGDADETLWEMPAAEAQGAKRTKR